MKILITGANGQLGNEFKTLSPEYPGFRFLFTDVAELDITSEEEIERMVVLEKPDAIVNCAAYTAVDKAEQEPGTAMKINSLAVENLARASAKHGVMLVHISTDYVFDGTAHTPYRETDHIAPVSAYAKSKASGEASVFQHASRAVIIRTSWLYSSFGHNFVKTILKYGRERGKLNVVYDQVGCPTYAGDLAGAVMAILSNPLDFTGTEIFHYSNEGVASWYDFAAAILEMAEVPCELKPIETKDYPLPAARPYYSVFNKSKIKERFGIGIPYWRDSLKKCIGIIINEKQ